MKELIAESPHHLWIVEFFAPWCGHCKNLAPEYEKAATNLKGLVKIAAIDCDKEQQLCGGFGIKGFPTIKVFKPSGDPQKPPTPEDYNGPRTAAGIANYATEIMPSYVTSLTKKNHDQFLEKNSDLPIVLSFTEKDKTSSLYKGLSAEFKGRLAFAEVKKSQKELVSQYEVKNFPSVLVLKKDGSKDHFKDKLSHTNLEKFLSSFAGPKTSTKSSSSSKSSKSKSSESHGSQDTHTSVPQASLHPVNPQSREEFQKSCLDFKLCVVSFFSEENTGSDLHSKFLETLDKVTHKHHKSFSFVWLDGVHHLEFMQFLHLESGFPGMAVISPSKNVYVPYVGSYEVDKITNFLDKLLRGSKPTTPFPGELEPHLEAFDRPPEPEPEPESEPEAESEDAKKSEL